MSDGLTLAVQRDSTDSGLPHDARLQDWVRAALGGNAGEVSILFTEADAARTLNRDYRGRDYATNVLSFPLDDAVLAQHRSGVFGDLVICPDVVRREAAEQGKDFEQHLAHLVVHGVLHLRGYDHEAAPQADEMEAVERDILGGLGYPDPYQPQEAE